MDHLKNTNIKITHNTTKITNKNEMRRNRYFSSLSYKPIDNSNWNANKIIIRTWTNNITHLDNPLNQSKGDLLKTIEQNKLIDQPEQENSEKSKWKGRGNLREVMERN